MAKLHSLLALQQFMQGLGEDMDEAELVRSTVTGAKLADRLHELMPGQNMDGRTNERTEI